MAKECKGEKYINEVYVWHGSNYSNYYAIIREGFKNGWSRLWGR